VSGNYPDLFTLLDDFDTRAKRLSDVINRRHGGASLSDTSVSDAITRGVAFLKSKLLSHPINIVMAAFLVGDQCLFDYDRVSRGVDAVTKLPLDEPRAAQSFLQVFPYEYLAAVYKVSYELYVHKIFEMPASAWFHDATIMAPFLERARADINEAR
jgi:hypothetical protein